MLLKGALRLTSYQSKYFHRTSRNLRVCVCGVGVGVWLFKLVLRVKYLIAPFERCKVTNYYLYFNCRIAKKTSFVNMSLVKPNYIISNVYIKLYEIESLSLQIASQANHIILIGTLKLELPIQTASPLTRRSNSWNSSMP